MTLVLTPQPGDQFKVVRYEGIFRTGDVWTVTEFLRMGAVERGAMALQCPQREILTLTMPAINALVRSGVLSECRRGMTEREHQMMELKASSPMRAAKSQDDASGLALFQHFDEPRLL